MGMWAEEIRQLAGITQTQPHAVYTHGSSRWTYIPVPYNCQYISTITALRGGNSPTPDSHYHRSSFMLQQGTRPNSSPSMYNWGAWEYQIQQRCHLTPSSHQPVLQFLLYPKYWSRITVNILRVIEIKALIHQDNRSHQLHQAETISIPTITTSSWAGQGERWLFLVVSPAFGWLRFSPPQGGLQGCDLPPLCLVPASHTHQV